jgi:hypothetical protein
MGARPVVRDAPGWRDNVVAMEKWLKAHPGAEWTRPAGGDICHRVRWERPGGGVVDESNPDLGLLVDRLERDADGR